MKNRNKQFLNEWILLWHEFEMFYYQFLRKYDLSMHSFHIMTMLRKNSDGMEPSLIAEELGILRQALAPLLNNLEKRGFISRSPRLDDHRRKQIILTATGREFVDAVEEDLSSLELDAFTLFPEEELAKMFNSMNRFHQALKGGCRERASQL